MGVARALVAGAVLLVPSLAVADDEAPESTLTIYGHVMLDSGFDFGQIGDPNWFDVLRPTKLPRFEDEFGDGPRTFWGVRQTRFGVKAKTPMLDEELKAWFEWEMFGVGEDAGQTTIRLRHAVGEWKQFRFGQTWSPFMDIDVFPNSIEYWGPNGMVFFRNVQAAWMPLQGESRITIALERPGATADEGQFTEFPAIEMVVPRFPVPDISAEARLGGGWGYVELAGIVRYIAWDDLSGVAPDLSGHEWGWGVNLSSNLKLDPFILRLQAVYGHGIQNYMNDGDADIGIEDTGDPARPLKGVALPIVGLVAFVDANWNDYFTSTAGWSYVWVDNTNGQTPDAFHTGSYALANILYHPSPRFFFGPEFQYARRTNFEDGFAVNDFRIQVSFKFMYERTIGGAP
jgi:hypothetical protein